MKRELEEREQKLKAITDSEITAEMVIEAIERIKGRINLLTIDGKRLILRLLNITVWAGGDKIRIEGEVPIEKISIEPTQPPPGGSG